VAAVSLIFAIAPAMEFEESPSRIKDSAWGFFNLAIGIAAIQTFVHSKPTKVYIADATSIEDTRLSIYPPVGTLLPDRSTS
jgi:F0F1-type ATP synthase membrane subunit a